MKDGGDVFLAKSNDGAHFRRVEQFLEFVIKGLVENPDEVVIFKQETDGKIAFNVRLAKGDAGKVIGKHGQTIDAIRAVLNAGATRVHCKASLEIFD